MGITAREFIKALSASTLLSDDELSEIREQFPKEELNAKGDAIARMLIKQGKITKFQALNIYQGRAKGLVFGEYVVLDKIGSGGMGNVYKAQHRRMKRLAAIKVMLPELTSCANSLKRFYREAEVAAKLQHPNIVCTYDASEAHGVHFLIMEYVDGCDLAQRLAKHGPLTVEQAINCVCQAARGLEYAHSQNVVHRDVKPSNLLVDRSGMIKVLDMGLARFNDPLREPTAPHQDALTESGRVLGTADYMSPEQATDVRNADHRSDIYSLGCTLYFLITGHVPYLGDTAIKKILAHGMQPIPSLRAACAQVPKSLDHFFQRMLAKLPHERVQTMGEVVQTFESLLAGQSDEESTFSYTDEPEASDEFQSFLRAVEAQSATGSSGSRLAEDTMIGSLSPKMHKVGTPNRFKTNQVALWSAIVAVVLIALGVFAWMVSGDKTPPVASVSKPSATPVDGNAKGSSKKSPAENVAPVSPQIPLEPKPRAQAATVPPYETPSVPKATVPAKPETPPQVPTPIFPPTPPPATVPSANVPTFTPPVTTRATATPPPTIPMPAPVPKIEPPVVKDSRLPIPEAAAQERAKQLLQEVFKADLAQAKQPEQKTALAEKLLKQANSTADDPASKYVMLQESLRLAIDVADVPLLERIVGSLTAAYAVEGMDIRIDALEKAFAKPRSSALIKSLAEAALGPLEELQSDEKFERAERFQAIVLAAARKSKDADLVKIFVERGKSLTASKQQLAAAEQARVVLATSPDDAAANLALGKYLCFVKEEWGPGYAHLAKGSNPMLAELATKSLVNPVGADAQVVLGDAWWNAAEAAKGAGKADLQTGSRYWYAKAAAQLTGLGKTKVEQRLQSLSGTLTKLSKLAPPIAKAPFDAQQARAHQVAWGKHLRTPIAFVSRTGVPLVLIPPGEFLMGSTDEQVETALKVADGINAGQFAKDRIQTAERPQHKVVITKPFLMSATEVTVGQFRKFVEASKYVTEAEQYGFGNSADKILSNSVGATDRGLNWKSPGYAVTDDSPASQITWNDACAYCAWLSEKEGRLPWYRSDGKGGWHIAAQADGYRLPSEAEWEYACRAGTTTQYSFGDDYTELKEYAGRPDAVGTSLPNAFGLYDMHGGVHEWCQDFYDENWYKKSLPNDPNGPSFGSSRVIRGGKWSNYASYCRSAFRYSYTASYRYPLGFRCVRVW